MLNDPVTDLPSRSARPAVRKGMRAQLHLPAIPLHFSERRLLLGTMDVLIVNAALLGSFILRSDAATMELLTGMQLRWFILLSIVWLAIGQVLDIYDLARSASGMHSAWAAGSNAVMTAVVYLLIPYVTPPLSSSRLNVLVFPLLATAGVAAWRVLYAQVFVQPAFYQRALVVGRGLGFAVSINMAKDVARELIEGGKVVRGYLGVGLQRLLLVGGNLVSYSESVDPALVPWSLGPPG